VERFQPKSYGTFRVLLTLTAAAILAGVVFGAPPQQGTAAGRFVVQVGAFAGQQTAAPLAGELTRRGFPAIVVPGNDYHRVVVGPFATESEAAAALSKLQQQGYQGYVRGDLPIPAAARAGASAAQQSPAPRAAAPPAQPPAQPRVAQPAPSPSAPPRQTPLSRPFVVQVGAYPGLQTAAPLTSELLQRGFPALVVPGDDYARVVVGPFASEQEASAALSGLQQQGYEGYVRGDLALPQSSETAAEAEPPVAPAPPEQTPQLAEAAAPPQPAPAPRLPPRTAPAPDPPTPTTPAPDEPPAATPREVETPASPPGPQPVTAPPAAVPEPAQPQPAPAEVPEPVAPEPETPAVVAEAPAPGPVSEPQQQETAALRPPEPEPQRPRAASGLKLLVLAGDGAINNIKQRVARDPVVQVTDENDRPIAGVAITFALPDRGASGVFANGARSMTILTDAQGTASAVGLTPNAVAGDLPIQVSASYQGQTASAVITQTNAIAAGAGMSAATIGIIGAVVAGAAVGAALALSGGDSTPVVVRPSGTATVRTGGVTIGAPAP
jgi:cell division protein FtsN